MGKKQEFKPCEKVWAIELRERCPELTYRQVAEEVRREFGYSAPPGTSTVKKWLSRKSKPVLLAHKQKDPQSKRKRVVDPDGRRSKFVEALAEWVRGRHSLGIYPKPKLIGEQGRIMAAEYKVTGLECSGPWVCKFMQEHKLPIKSTVTYVSSVPQQLDQTQEYVFSYFMFLARNSWFCNIVRCSCQLFCA